MCLPETEEFLMTTNGVYHSSEFPNYKGQVRIFLVAIIIYNLCVLALLQIPGLSKYKEKNT